MSEKKAVLMRVNVAGFADRPATIFAAYDPGTDVLAISRVAKEYEAGDRQGFLKITNQQRDTAFDALFTEEEMREAIVAFFDLESLKLLNMTGDAARCNPSAKIERDGMDENGLKFRFDPSINNSQVAVLAACLYANRQRGFSQAQDFAEAMRILTI